MLRRALISKIFFPTTRELEYYFFLSLKARFSSLQHLTLSYLTKNLNQIIIFSSTKIRIFFSATLGIRISFLEKNHIPSSSYLIVTVGVASHSIDIFYMTFAG
jgi:hypothetical protein